jgi:hypothetical protein
MAGLEEGSVRYHILQTAKNFKTSWIELGRSLYAVYRDKLYKEWGFGSFDIYVAREIGLKKITAMKLLRSYYFLEKEEPGYLSPRYSESADVAQMPSYESIDILRLAKNNKNVDTSDYEKLKKDVFEQGKDARDARKELGVFIKQREELEPDEARERRKFGTVRRFMGTLKALRNEMEESKLISSSLLKDIATLMKKLETEIS